VSESQTSVLVTGANGFVGSRLCKYLIAQGFHVIAGVRKTSDCTLLEELNVEYRYGDVTDPTSLPEMVAGVDYVVHNAGVIKAKKRETYFAVNELGTKDLLDTIVKSNPDVTRVVYISSVAAAGPSAKGKPVRESDPPHPITTYGQSKLAGEKMALSFADRLNVVSVRPPAVYGPGDKEILTLFKTVYGHIKPYIGDTSRKLQLVHVDDLCAGIHKALIADTPSGEAYFVAEHQANTMRELMNLLQKACGRWTVPLYLPAPLFRGIAAISEFSFRLVGATPMLTREKVRELNASWEMDVSKASDELGFVSQIPFEEGARTTYEWYISEGWL